MTFWKRLFQKSIGRTIMVGTQMNRPAMSQRNYEAFSREGYQKNVIAFRCINLISGSAMRVPLKLMRQKGDKIDEVKNHAILDLLHKPNPMQGYAKFIQDFINYYSISGNSYIEGVGPDDTDPETLPTSAPKELWVLPSKFLTPVKGRRGIPSGYQIQAMGGKKIFPVNPITAGSRIMHMKTFNPFNVWEGMSPMEAISYNIDILNEANRWNYALLKNGSAPSVVFEVDTSQYKGNKLTPEQRSLLRQDIEENYSNPSNAGRPYLLEGGLTVTKIGFNMKELDFIKGKNVTSRDIAQGFGVPEQLVGVPESQKFDNNAEAKIALITDTVVPVMECVAGHFNIWLLPSFDPSGELYLQVDEDGIAALEPLRRKRWDKVEKSTFLTINEKREAVGLGRIDESDDPADMILVNSSLIPLNLLSVDFDSDADSSTQDLTGDPDDDDDGKSQFKAVDTTTQIGKRSKWLQIDRMRRRFHMSFAIQLAKAFNDEGEKMADAFSLTDSLTTGMTEFIINSVLEETRKSFEAIYDRSLTAIMTAFSDDIFDLEKSQGFEFEAKITPQKTKFNSFMKDFIKSHSGKKITLVQGVTKKKVIKIVRDVIEQGAIEGGVTSIQVAKRISEGIGKKYKTFGSRALTIARTETHTASQVAQRKAASTLTVKVVQEWVPAPPSNRRRGSHQQMRGVTAEVDGDFLVPREDGSGNDTMKGPGDPNAPAGQIINCACVLVFVKLKE